ncbi:glycosyltransferase family 2 protein [Geminisphaera colitermitum]|uniref:glycosyltransferase family 2 protein n=1 Tax=Geminisphaera colitermitum TaxID=1148786 RepID=UPI000158D3D4|nr:glycosyltransferase family 2 protein [Geminisphaera colitermitum]
MSCHLPDILAAPADESFFPEISVVLPCLNEVRTLAACIDVAKQAFVDLGVRGEVVVADNGSTDGSCDLARAHGARLVPVTPHGYGHALRAGIEAARAPLVIMGDADGSYDFSGPALKPFLEALRAGNDLVVGNRFAGGIRSGAMPWKNRYIGNPLLSACGRLFFQSPCRDFHCGLRALRKSVWPRLALRTGGMEFASEMIVRASLLGLRMAEVPATLSPDGRDRPPHLRPWRDGWRHLRFMLLFSPRWLFLYPGFFLCGCGVVLGGRLLAGPLRLGGVTLDVHTLLFCAIAVLTGFQSIQFSVFAKAFAIRCGLWPRDRSFENLMSRLSLESGLVVGVCFILAGLALGVAAVAQWGSRHFGDLSPQETLRQVIPSGMLLTLGVQIVLGSFFLGILGLNVLPVPTEDEENGNAAGSADSTFSL